jgi:5-methyltetrahydrofolate--homocysteine methyltransferase
MTPADFQRALSAGRVLLMDGAMGTQLQRAGLEPGECGTAWNLTRPQRVRAVHQAYVAAGAEVLLTNTFQANPVALACHGLEDRLEEINRAAVALARAAAGPSRFVLGDVGPMPGADRETLRRVIASLEGVDGILFETFSDPEALSAVEYVLHRVPEADGVPLLLAISYLRDASGRLVCRSGHGPETFARHAARHGVTALGANCGRDISPLDLAEIMCRYQSACDLPLFARPNAGTPTRGDGSWVYPHRPEEMAARLPRLLDAGVSMVGGCCGTTPAYIAAFARVIARKRQSEQEA